MNRFIVACIICFLAASCVTQERCSKKFPCNGSTDTIRIKETTYIPVDTFFKIKADSSSIQALIDCQGEIPRLKQIIAYSTGKLVKIPIITMKHDTLFVDCVIDSSSVAFRYYQQHVSEFIKTNKTVVSVVYEQRWYQKMFMYIGIVASILIILWVIFLVLKVYGKFQIPFLK